MPRGPGLWARSLTSLSPWGLQSRQDPEALTPVTQDPEARRLVTQDPEACRPHHPGPEARRPAGLITQDAY